MVSLTEYLIKIQNFKALKKRSFLQISKSCFSLIDTAFGASRFNYFKTLTIETIKKG